MNAIINYILLGCFALVYIRLFIPYTGFFSRYMFNEPTLWDKYVEKPRLVFYGTGLLLMHSNYRPILEGSEDSLGFFFYASCFIFLGGIAMCLTSYTKRFKSVFIPRIKQQLKPQKQNFEISATTQHLVDLYNELVRYDLVARNRTSIEDFINVLTKDWKTHNSKIYLKLDSPSCREFYELLRTVFPNNSLTLIDFIERSDTIRREDGQMYNYNTVKNALYRTHISSSSEDLKAAFSKLEP
ncbi:MAG: hypothetical protein WBB27_06985 [Maribacter sp.]